MRSVPGTPPPSVLAIFFYCCLALPSAALGQTTPPPDPFLGVTILSGGASTPGGAVTITNHATVARSGAGNHGIVASSTSGGYSDAVLDSLRNFSAAPFSFTTTAVWNADRTAGDLGGPVTGARVNEDGDPLPGGGGSFTLAGDGSFSFDPGNDFADLAAGASVKTSVTYQVEGTNSSNGATKNATGTLVVTVKKADDGTLTYTADGCDFGDVFGSSSRPTDDSTVFPDLKAYVTGMLRFSYSGGPGSAVAVVNDGLITTDGSGAYGILASTQGQNGANGRNAGIFRSSQPGAAGGAGGAVTVTADGQIETGKDDSAGVVAMSVGGNGGSGGAGGWWWGAKTGGPGASGAAVSVLGSGTISTTGARSIGIFALSQGGNGGAGGGGATFVGAANGAAGGAGGTVTVNGSWTITTHGTDAYGIFAKSVGGVAGSGGNGGWTGTSSGGGGQGTWGGTVNVTSGGEIHTYGSAAHGVYAMSVGGFGGSGGSGSSIFYASGGNGAGAGSGGTVSVANALGGQITTEGAGAHGIFAQSIGGGGGSGGSGSALVGFGGSSQSGGEGGLVTVTNRGTITTKGAGSLGIYAQSIGGSGGDGGSSYGLAAIGGQGSATSNGGAVSVSNLGTIKSKSTAIFAQSIGGGGGNGGSSTGWISIGGSGGSGGNAGKVAVSSHGELETKENNANAIFAQSLGGGGGNGGNSVAVPGSPVTVAIGGSGAAGGTGADAKVGVDATTSAIDPVTGIINTYGYKSSGIVSQSIGGGGGNGGYAVSVNVGNAFAAAFALGGKGGGGNSAGNTSLYFGDATSSITTRGDEANGIFAQSLGGGGGTGGFAVAATGSFGFSASISLGGSGGTGGSAGTVTVGSAANPLLGSITTGGRRAYGIFAESVGGGGGSGGLSISGSAGVTGVSFAMGGSGAGGGHGSTVNVTSGSAIETSGPDAHGLFAQSVGGGGGSGGFAIGAGIATTGNINVGVGGTGAGGGNGSTVTVRNLGSIKTHGDLSYGLLAQSVGGGGGNGGFSVAAGVSQMSATVGVGGKGGGGGTGSTVDVTNDGAITTAGQAAHGLFAQSVGGGGGNGGFSIAGSVTTTGALNFALGASAGTGGSADSVTVLNRGAITTGGDTRTGKGSYGILAQSVGGGGGTGGFGGSFSAMFGASGASLSVAVGGNGGGAGHGAAVTATNEAAVTTKASGSIGLFAQSIGGGGGDAGFGLNLSLSAQSQNASAGVVIGGKGGGGGNASTTTVTNRARIETAGDHSQGILAQSIGGGGGNGGLALNLMAGINFETKNLGVSIGGSGGIAGNAGHVTVTNDAALVTTGADSHAIQAQSIGGGGGNGGMSVNGTLAGPPAKTFSIAVGGSGGAGGTGGQVDVLGSSAGSVSTAGDRSHGVFAQSIGGGGGAGGFAAAAALGIGDMTGTSIAVSAAVGGSGGIGNAGGAVNVGTAASALKGNITTKGQESVGIFAQSIGGGGGIGGGSLAASLTLMPAQYGPNVDIGFSVGGGGGKGNHGGVVLVHHEGTIDTSGDGSHGIEAQSIGGGGGNGGSSRAISLQLGPSFMAAGTKNFTMNFSVGGFGSGGGNGAAVSVTHTGDITTRGGDAYGIFAQSIGGGGGAGGDGHQGLPGFGEIGLKLFSQSSFGKSLKFVAGGSGGASGSGGSVFAGNTGALTTYGDGSAGVFAQSIGGGGGAGGNGALGLGAGLLSFAVGGGVGTTGDGGSVTATIGGSVTTFGNGANGILAQSIGGGGGMAGGVDRGLKNYANIGWGFAFGQDGGGGGDGGAVTVNSTAAIWTKGTGSNGIFAQSVGGGGGIVGGTGNDLPVLSVLNFAGSVGGEGSGGAVNVNQTGNVITIGDAADGIFAQSAGGRRTGGIGGLGGAVDVTLNSGNILATGAESNGIFAQSLGEGGNGNISVNIANASSVVLGGSYSGAAVRFADGNINTLTNRGTLAAGAGVSGTTVIGGAGHERVNNFGTVIGSLDLGGGTNAFTNNAGALFTAGLSITLGSGGLFTNAGALSLGDAGRVQRTDVTGHFMQAGTPRWLVDIGQPGVSDTLAVSGTANLGASVTTVDINELLTPSSSGSYALLTAQSGLSGAQFRLGSMYGAMPIGQTFDFANSDTKEALTLLPSTGSFYWTGGVGGAWTTPFVNGVSNWTRSGGSDYVFGTPGAGSNVVISAMGAALMGADFTINSLTFAGGGLSIAEAHSLTLMGGGGRGLTVQGNARLGVNVVLGGDQWWLNDGTFRVDGLDITGSGRHLTIDGSGTTVVSAAIRTGGGSLTKTGTGVLALRAPNSYSGGTRILGGTLLGDTTSLQGNIENNATLIFDQITSGTFAGSISGTGWLVKQNNGALTLTGSNSFTGGTWASGGTLIGNTASLPGDILNESMVVFDQAVEGTYAGSMGGGGALLKQGGGSLTMTGNSFGFGGNTVVQTGELFVDGALGGSSLVLQRGTLLGGTGWLNTNVIVQPGAVFAPGHSVGTIRVLGDLRFEPGATYRVETAAYGSSDLTLVGGQLFATGATLEVNAGGTQRYRPINVYPVFGVNGGVNGTFANVTTNAGYLDPSVQYQSGYLGLTLRRNDVDFRSVGTRGNQTSVASVLNQLVKTATGALAGVVNNVYDLPDDRARSAMSSMTGLMFQHVARNSLDIPRSFATASMRRLGAVVGTGGRLFPSTGVTTGMAQAGAVHGTGADYGAWLSGLGGVTEYLGDDANASARAPMRGFIAGFDFGLGDAVTVGVSGGQAWPEVTLDGSPDRADSTMNLLNVYGRYARKRMRLDALVGFNGLEQNVFRQITDGVTTLAASSHYHGSGAMFQAEYGYNLELGRGLNLEPTVGLQVGQVRFDGFGEENGDVLSLSVPGRTVQSGRTLLGATMWKSLGSVWGARMLLEGRGSWGHELQRFDDVTVRFTADPFAHEFSLAAATARRDSALLGLGLTAVMRGNLRLFAEVDGDLGGPSKSWRGSFGLNKTW